ncbi:uncharacterized protein BROUX77_002438 [Berkeleyomyces rouxiae]|uniref:uncharacterized protein n=1 Tax=Berkeleyomyces rouxiae TaxID=2035830 RepID=UPI003B78F33A
MAYGVYVQHGPASLPKERYDNFQRLLDLERQLHSGRMKTGLQPSQEARRPPLNTHHQRSASHTTPHIAPISAVHAHQRYSTSAATDAASASAAKAISTSLSHPHVFSTPHPATHTHSSSFTAAPRGSSSPPRVYRSQPLSLPLSLSQPLPLPPPFDSGFDSDSSSACQSPIRKGYYRQSRDVRKSKEASACTEPFDTDDDAREPQSTSKRSSRLTKPPPSASKTPYLYREKTSSNLSKSSVASGPDTSSSSARQGRQQTRQDNARPRSRSRSITDRIRTSFDLSSHRRRERSATVTSEISVPVSMTPSEYQIPVTDLSGPEPRIIQNPGMCKTYRETNRLTKLGPKRHKAAASVATNVAFEEPRGRTRTQEQDKTRRRSFLGWKRDSSKHSARALSTGPPINMSAAHQKAGSVAIPHQEFLDALSQPYSPPELGFAKCSSARPQSFSHPSSTNNHGGTGKLAIPLRTTSMVPAAPIVTIVTPDDKAASDKTTTPVRRGFRDAARAAFRRSISRPPPEYETAAMRKQKLGANSPAHHTMTSLPISSPLELSSPPRMPNFVSSSPPAPKAHTTELRLSKTTDAVSMPERSPEISSPSLSSAGSPPNRNHVCKQTPLRAVVSHGHLDVPSAEEDTFAIPRKSSRRQRVRPARIPVGLMKDIDSANESDSPGPYTPSDPNTYFPQHSKFGHGSPRIRSDSSDVGFGDRNASSLSLYHQANLADQKVGPHGAVSGFYPLPLRYQKDMPSPKPAMRTSRIPSPYGILSPYDEDSLVESQASSLETPSTSVTASNSSETAESLDLGTRSGLVRDLRGSSDPLTKTLVQCCHCKFYHDMPSTVYQCMAVYDPVIKDKVHENSGTIASSVCCPWCQHGMKTTCCAGYTATVHLTKKLH